jgi:hypothetical protein
MSEVYEEDEMRKQLTGGRMKRFVLFLLVVLAFTIPTMGAKFYVNLNINHAYDRLGKTADSAFGGAIGLQRFFDTCVAGDTALVWGNGDERKIAWLSYGIVTGNFGRGDTLVNMTRAGSAVVYQDSAAIKMLVEVQSGSFALNDSIRNNQSTIFAKQGAAPSYPGLTIWKTSGTYNAPIKIIGVNSSWVNTGYQDTIDGYDAMSDASNGTNITVGKASGAAAINYISFHNIIFNRGRIFNIRAIAVGFAGNWFLNNCMFNGGAATTACIKYFGSPYINQCKFANAGIGMLSCNLVGEFDNCFYTNVQYGALGVDGHFSQCVMAGKGGTSGYCGISPYNLGVNVNNCDIDSFGTGILLDKGLVNAVTKSKITSCQGAPIQINANYRIFECDNLFLNNGGSNAILVNGALVSCGNSVYTGTIGYTNKAGGDFSPTINATGCRVKSNIGGK